MEKSNKSPKSLISVFQSMINDKKYNKPKEEDILPPVIQSVKMRKNEMDSIYVEIDEMIPFQNSISKMEFRFAENILSQLGIDCEESQRIEITTYSEELTRLIIFISRSKPRNL
jgi:hypothetical protein